MKKITLLVLLSTFALGAQEGLVRNNGLETASAQRDAQAIIFDQPSAGGSGIVSDVFNGIPGAVYSADDFIIEADNIAEVDMITVYGFQSSGNFLTAIEGFDLYIYADIDGFPGGDPSGAGEAALLEIVNLAPDSPALTIVETVSDDPMFANSYDLTVDVTVANGEALTLEAGLYWIVAAPRVGASETNSPDRWNWFDAGVDVGEQAHLIDVDDLFGAGATSWTPFTDLGLTFDSIAFTIEGTETLSAGNNGNIDSFSVYPNPTVDRFNITGTNNLSVKGVTIFNLLGQSVLTVDGNTTTVDISSLNRGVYVVEILGENNTKTTRRIVKN